MYTAVKHVFRVASSQVREHVVKGIIHPLTGKRSSKWPGVRRAFLESNPTCAACGGTKWLNVHHKMPFHDAPELELDPRNLITLCMGKKECHLLIGHGDDFKAYNGRVANDAASVRNNPEKWEEVVTAAKRDRLYEPNMKT